MDWGCECMFNHLFIDFINNISEFDNYQVGITDIQGKFIASTIKSKLGTISSQAIKIIDNGDNSIKLNINSSEIYAAIAVKKNMYGVLWIRGSADSIDMVCMLILNSLKIRIEVEINKQLENNMITMEDQLVDALIHYDEDSEDFIKDICEELNIDLYVPRIVIIVSNKSTREFTIDSNRPLFNRQDLVSKINKDSYVILKKYTKPLEMESFQNEMDVLINSLKESFDLCARYFISIPQDNYKLLSICYRQCRFLEKNIKNSGDIIYFKDYFEQYFMSQVSSQEYEALFSFFMYKQLSFNIKEFVDIFDVMIQNNFNISQTSKDLFMHKNTLFYKINKYRRIFGIDFIGEHKNRMMLSYWLFWMKKSIKKLEDR